LSVPTCSFIREATGLRCKAVAVKGSDRCHHHQLDQVRMTYLKGLRKDPTHKQIMEAMDLPPLETLDDIQICLSNLFHAVAHRRLINPDIEHLLAILRLASRNIRLQQMIDAKSERKPQRSAEREIRSAKDLTDEEIQEALKDVFSGEITLEEIEEFEKEQRNMREGQG
jgi:hypothetical protein